MDPLSMAALVGAGLYYAQQAGWLNGGSAPQAQALQTLTFDQLDPFTVMVDGVRWFKPEVARALSRAYGDRLLESVEAMPTPVGEAWRILKPGERGTASVGQVTRSAYQRGWILLGSHSMLLVQSPIEKQILVVPPGYEGSVAGYGGSFALLTGPKAVTVQPAPTPPIEPEDKLEPKPDLAKVEPLEPPKSKPVVANGKPRAEA